MTSGRRRRDRGHPLFARIYAFMAARAERGELGRRRSRLLSEATGRVVELGPGTGENFKHYPAAVTSVDAVEPDPTMRRLAAPRVAASQRIEMVDARGDSLPFPDASFDTAVATLVLCSVDPLDVVLAELRRVLAPGGRLLVLEHVRSSGRLGKWQDRLARPWGAVSGGCHPDRRTLDEIARAGFSVGDMEHFDLPGVAPLVRPHVQGTARKPGSPHADEAGTSSDEESSSR